MPSKPTTVPTWATAAAPGDVVAPSPTKQAAGWVVEIPPHEYFNWWQFYVGGWCDWLNSFESTAHTWAAQQNFQGDGTNSVNVNITSTAAGHSALFVTNTGGGVGLTIGAGGLTVTAGGIAVTAGGLTVTAGGLTVTAGGLTVAAGGASITGNSTVTGTLNVTGAITGGVPTITTPALNAGANISGKPKLSYWKDASGAVHIEGAIALTGAAAHSVTAWAAGALPSGYRPGANIQLISAGATVGGATYLWAEIQANGSLIFTANDGTDAASASFAGVFHPSIPLAP